MPDPFRQPLSPPRMTPRRAGLPFLVLAAGLILAACVAAPPTAPTPLASHTTAPSIPLIPEPTETAGPTPTELPSPSSSPAPTPVARPSPSPSSTTPLPSPPVAPSASPAAAPVNIDAELAGRLQAVVDASRVRIPTPGLSVAIRLPSGEIWTSVSGSASLQPEVTVTTETSFAVASISKTFVTALILQLVDEDVLSLDDPLADFVPDFPRARRLTLRQLLEHKSGVFNFFEHPDYVREVFADPSRRWTFDEILGFLAAPYCAPGACFHYSNTNFVLLGRVAEEATGTPIHAEIRERFLDPLALDHTVFQPDEPTPTDAAHGHLEIASGFVDHTGRSRVIPHLSAVTVAWAAGAIASTPTDLVRWADALYGGEILSAELTAEMMAYRLSDEYGLGMRTRVFNERRAVGHLGGIRGFENAMWYFPDTGVTIVISANRGMFSTDKTMRLLVRALFGS